MHNVIVGTAGHVDHGKTCLIKALTGIDTDRLKEEKKRGITIELGFADLKNTGEQHIGIIDVPGHEKFIKNMLAGIGGIDIVLLVIAADEGIMPQTREHLEILKTLSIKKGIIVITKIDLVDKDWLEMVMDDVHSLVNHTFLEQAAVLPVSVFTGENIDRLRELICDLAKDCSQRREDAKLFRLPIDRVFTIDGFGTVLTGTLLEGSVEVGDEIVLYPVGKSLKVRSLQVHGQMVKKALAGQRTALNITGLKKEEIKRGYVLAARGSMKNAMMLDVKLDIFKSSARTLKNGSRVHLYYGSAEVVCKVVLLDRDNLESGVSAYAQLRTEVEIALKKGDRFIIRYYSPVETIGGGVVLDANPMKHKRFRKEVLQALKIKEENTGTILLEQVVKEESKNFLSHEEYAVKLGITEKELNELENTLLQEDKILQFGSIILHKEFMLYIAGKAHEILSVYHKENSTSPGMGKEEFRGKLSDRLHLKEAKIEPLLILELVRRGFIARGDKFFALCDFRPNFSDAQVEIKDRIERIYLTAGYEVPDVETVLLAEKDKKAARQVIDALLGMGTLYKLSFRYYMHRDHWEKALNLLTNAIYENGRITLGEYRDLLSTSRKYAVLILEHLDEKKITVKDGDGRVLNVF